MPSRNSALREVKSRVFSILEGTKPNDPTTKVVQLAILGLIALTLIFLVLESVESVYSSWGRVFRVFESATVVVFSLEYILRVWSCTSDSRYKDPLGRLRFAVSPLA